MRKLRRLVAHKKMKKAELQSVNKIKNGEIRSYFARHWREYV